MLALQRNVDFSQVGVILVNDGEESSLPDELFKDYPYRVTNITIPHSGVSVARNTGIDRSEADWVMVCDFDDQFCSTLGLQLLFSAIQEDDKDMYWTHFLEEVRMDDGSTRLLPHNRDVIFVHGKLFRRSWLNENRIRFHNGLTLHEDVFLNTLAQAIAPEDRIGEIQTGYYLWCYNPESVGRSYGGRFIFETYDHLMKQRNEIAKEFAHRNMEQQMTLTVVKTVIDAFYDFQCRTWHAKDDAEQYKLNERWFCTFLKKWGRIYAKADATLITQLVTASRDFHVKQGALIVEVDTLAHFLNHMMDEVEPFELNVLDVEP